MNTTIDHLIIQPGAAIEYLANSNYNNFDLELCGTKPLRDCHSGFCEAIKAGHLTEKSRFHEVFGLDKNFFYNIEQIKDNKVVAYERGVACVYKKNDKYFLNRKSAFVIGENSGSCRVNTTGKPSLFVCHPEGSHTIIYSSAPPTYLECLAPENSIITSTYSCMPQTVPFKKDSFLIRFEDNIENVESKDKRFVDIITNAIMRFTKQIKLQASKLTTKRSETEILDLKPSINPKAKRGTIYYDNNSDTLKFYNGSTWKTIAFVEDVHENS